MWLFPVRLACRPDDRRPLSTNKQRGYIDIKNFSSVKRSTSVRKHSLQRISSATTAVLVFLLGFPAYVCICIYQWSLTWAFSVAGTTVCNPLLDSLRDPAIKYVRLGRDLKTHLVEPWAHLRCHSFTESRCINRNLLTYLFTIYRQKPQQQNVATHFGLCPVAMAASGCVAESHGPQSQALPRTADRLLGAGRASCGTRDRSRVLASGHAPVHHRPISAYHHRPCTRARTLHKFDINERVGLVAIQREIQGSRRSELKRTFMYNKVTDIACKWQFMWNRDVWR